MEVDVLPYECYTYMIIPMRPNLFFHKWLVFDTLLLTWLQLLLGVCTVKM